MSDTVRDWLPPNALTVEAVGEAMGEIIDGWSRRWFAPGEVIIAALSNGAAAPSVASEPAGPVAGKVARAVQTGRAKRHMLEAALDVSLADRTPTQADHRLLDALANEIMSDLVGDVDSWLEGSRPTGEDALLSVTLARGGRELATISFPAHAIISALKARLRQARNTDALTGRLVALGAMTVRTEAILGRAMLTVEDVEGLAIGDVLILDRMLDSKVDLRLCDQPVVIAAGRLDKRGDQVSLSF